MMAPEERARFSDACAYIAEQERNEEGIGTLSEKSLHKILKRFYGGDADTCEVRISPDGSARLPSEAGEEPRRAESGRGGYIADICREGRIYEIQTGSFLALKRKLEFYLLHTDFSVTVVYPVAAVKWLCWISPEDGNVSGHRRSPKRGSGREILPEMFWISEFLEHPRLTFEVPLLELCEYRLLDGWSGDKKKGSHRYERIPASLSEILRGNARSLAEELMPESLPAKFTASEASKALKMRGKKLYAALKTLCTLGLLTRSEQREGRSYVFYQTKFL